MCFLVNCSASSCKETFLLHCSSYGIGRWHTTTRFYRSALNININQFFLCYLTFSSTLSSFYFSFFCIVCFYLLLSSLSDIFLHARFHFACVENRVASIFTVHGHALRLVSNPVLVCFSHFLFICFLKYVSHRLANQKCDTSTYARSGCRSCFNKVIDSRKRWLLPTLFLLISFHNSYEAHVFSYFKKWMVNR